MTPDIRRLAFGALMPGVNTAQIERWLVDAIAAGVESVCLFSDAIGTVERTRATAAALHSLNPALLVATDEEGGEVTRLESTTGSSLLSALALGAIDDPAVTAASARIEGRMLAGVGIDWTFAPVADVNVDPRNPVIGVRSFGKDAAAVGAHVAAYVAGVQRAGVLATAKHFPGHGDTHVDSHESLPALDVTLDDLRAREMVPFVAAINAGVASVMTGHLLVSAIDPVNPASLSSAVTSDLLRGELGFDGVVVTDAVEMGAVAGADRSNLANAAVQALIAGADVVCLGAADQQVATIESVKAIVASVAAGLLSVERLAHAAARRRRVRLLATDAGEVALDITLVADAATRSIRTHGLTQLDNRAVDVLRISAAPGYAAGPTAWGVGLHLEAHGFDVAMVSDIPTDVGRTLVVETRDVWKSTVLLESLQRTLRARPDAVVVDFGWPIDPLPGTAAWVTTHGSGLLSSVLAACALTGQDMRAAAAEVLELALISAHSLPTDQQRSHDD